MCRRCPRTPGELETDLLAVDGCGQSRLRERDFGGGTPHVLDDHNGSLLIAR
jgi:hypothetical protein